MTAMMTPAQDRALEEAVFRAERTRIWLDWNGEEPTEKEKALLELLAFYDLERGGNDRWEYQHYNDNLGGHYPDARQVYYRLCASLYSKGFLVLYEDDAGQSVDGIAFTGIGAAWWVKYKNAPTFFAECLSGDCCEVPYETFGLKEPKGGGNHARQIEKWCQENQPIYVYRRLQLKGSTDHHPRNTTEFVTKLKYDFLEKEAEHDRLDKLVEKGKMSRRKAAAIKANITRRTELFL